MADKIKRKTVGKLMRYNILSIHYRKIYTIYFGSKVFLFQEDLDCLFPDINSL